MESLGKVIAEIHEQWGIKCKLKDFESAIKRLLTLGVIDHPVDILHSKCWERCTNALAKDVIMSDTSKCLKSWGRVMQALEKALEEQETWKVAQQCLRITPKLGVGATTQTTLSDSFASSGPLVETGNPSQSRSSSPTSAPNPTTNSNPPPNRDNFPCFEGNTNNTDIKQIGAKPPPYAPQYGAEAEQGGRGQELFPTIDMCDREQEEGGMAHDWEGKLEPYQKVNLQTSPYKTKTPLEGRRSKRDNATTHQKSRGRSPTKRHSRPEVPDQSTSSQSEEEFKQALKPVRDERWRKLRHKGQRPSCERSDSDSDSKLEVDSTPAAFTKFTDPPTWHLNRKDSCKPMPLMEWKKVQTALADLPETAARIFPVKRLDNNLPTYSPVNPKDVQAVAKAIAEKGINSAMVSTLIDGLFGNDDMLPFDIKQMCRMIFDGAGMIVFKQE
ncbi:hypothetical protein HGM15179_015259 [Zosterops borbonicus]|uniref:Gag polyprotein n=1 Tax=Zosterops borbonicus TaxID=364589 RepID=A0A8K1G565_9PASS|nr:hypothetical protein HGM15179_015259 [Zosterops borbonicus]